MEIPKSEEAKFQRLLARYPFSATPYYLSLIDWDNPRDPILRQCIPTLEELNVRHPASSPDPFLEECFSPVPGLVHRYPDRALVITNNMCAVFCRHCNRKRNWPRERPSSLDSVSMDAIINYIKGHPEIREVIFSGGDPLLLGTNALAALLSGVRAIDHVEVLRIGTRTPVTMPMRIDEELSQMLAKFRPIWVNTHFNHPREITPESSRAIERLLKQGIPVCNQSVLLKGVNDDFDTMRSLLTGLEAICVKPYYLFQCDPVEGTDHLRTDILQGIRIMERLWGEIGGLCIPLFVADLPGAKGKAPLMRSWLLSADGGEAVFRTQDGAILKYGIL